MRHGDRPGSHRRGTHRGRSRTRLITTATVVALALAGTTAAAGAGLHRQASPSASTQRPDPTAVPDAATESVIPEPPTARESTAASTRDRPRVRIPRWGAGDFAVAGGAETAGGGTGRSEVTYTMEVEAGLPFAPRSVARVVDRVLDDDRGWPGVDGRSFRRVSQTGDLRILLATPGTTDELCAPLETNGRVSCRNGELVVLNARRWAFATEDYRDAEAMYRTYLINHEVGHAIGYGHTDCPGPGEPAPVMQQQTYGLEGCRRNPWPSVA